MSNERIPINWRPRPGEEDINLDYSGLRVLSVGSRFALGAQRSGCWNEVTFAEQPPKPGWRPTEENGEWFWHDPDAALSLKPCPFCGTPGPRFSHDTIYCTGCGANGPVDVRSKQDAARRWNERVSDAELDVLRKQVDAVTTVAERMAKLVED